MKQELLKEKEDALNDKDKMLEDEMKKKDEQWKDVIAKKEQELQETVDNKVRCWTTLFTVLCSKWMKNIKIWTILFFFLFCAYALLKDEFDVEGVNVIKPAFNWNRGVVETVRIVFLNLKATLVTPNFLFHFTNAWSAVMCILTYIGSHVFSTMTFEWSSYSTQEREHSLALQRMEEEYKRAVKEKHEDMMMAIEERELQKTAALSAQDNKKDELQRIIDSLETVRIEFWSEYHLWWNKFKNLSLS